MNKLELLKNITTKPELATLLGVKHTFLTHTLYILKPATQYSKFDIPKRNGGKRTIHAPSDKLKSLQSGLSKLLLDCIDDINKVKFPNPDIKRSTLAHGFVRKRSIMTNALVHIDQKNVLNIDLSDFFDSFNFGRVRGFFIKNKHFKLNPHIATVIAQIACYDNKLPQGSPCSPVITNLITHSLDIKLAFLARKHSCIYSRYADDITFSTRKLIFPNQIIREEGGEFIAGKKLRNEIKRAGFSINDKKTRIQYKDSRQDVTGLIVNEKPNVKKEYWRTVKSQCHRLFQTGAFIKKTTTGEVKGNINELEGQLNCIDQVDRFNRARQKPHLNHIYEFAKYGHKTSPLLSGREKTLSRFLYYRLFYGNTKPTILCEGKTDNVYLKSAINKLAGSYPKLANEKNKATDYNLLIRFVEYSKRTRFLLELYGGTSYLSFFISKFDRHYKFYKAPRPQFPVIIVLDNDKGFSGKKDKGVAGKLKDCDSVTVYPETLTNDAYREADFIHVMHNFYIVLTPLDPTSGETAIEDLFDKSTRDIKVSEKTFNPNKEFDHTKEYGKEIFANKVIKAQKDKINFDGLKPLLDRMVKAINHYDLIKSDDDLINQ